jgi:broad specificity phosphatase PhoE
MARTLIHLVRHGEVRNDEGVLYGSLPGFHLSDRGREMADAAAAHFAGRDVRLVLSSPLDRTQETAAAIAGAVGRQVVTDARLTEAANRFEGSVFGAADLLRRPARIRHLTNPMLPTWGEHYSDQAVRMRGALDDALDHVDGGEAVLVSHQSPIWVLRCTLSGRRSWGPPSRRQCSLDSVTTLSYESGELVAVSYTEPYRFT